MFTLSRRPHPIVFASFLLLAAAPLAFAGCFINVSDGTGGAGGDTTSSSSADSSSSSAGQGGSGGTGSSTSAGTGGNMCVGTGQTAASCNLMEITPSRCNGPAASNCDPTGGTGGTDDPPGFAVCVHGFAMFTAGSAENLRECLGQINGAPATACDFAPVVACFNQMYAEACSSSAATAACQQIKDSLCTATESFDLAKCADDLKPVNGTGIQRVADCITASPDPVCQTAYDTCVNDEIMSARPVMTCP